MTTLKKIIKKFRDQHGIGLAETLVAVAILGTAVVTFVISLSTGTLAVNEQDTETVAQSLAQTQLEYTKNYAFTPSAITYPTVTAPSGYSITVSVATVTGTDTNIQKIIVNILQNSVTVLTVSGYKVNR
jgi:type II secretory pathway pseudopilin PulG